MEKVYRILRRVFEDRKRKGQKENKQKKRDAERPELSFPPLTKRTKCSIPVRSKSDCSLTNGVFLSCVQNPLPSCLIPIVPLSSLRGRRKRRQCIDLALTSTYGDGLSLRKTAGLRRNGRFCTLDAASGRAQIDLAFSPDKGFACSRAGQWAQFAGGRSLIR